LTDAPRINVETQLSRFGQCQFLQNTLTIQFKAQTGRSTGCPVKEHTGDWVEDVARCFLSIPKPRGRISVPIAQVDLLPRLLQQNGYPLCEDPWRVCECKGSFTPVDVVAAVLAECLPERLERLGPQVGAAKVSKKVADRMGASITSKPLGETIPGAGKRETELKLDRTEPLLDALLINDVSQV